MNNEDIYLPVSLGEAIDKLTILDIKLYKITSIERKMYIKKEYDILYDKLKHFLIQYNDLYLTMKKVNIQIWDMMDILRDGDVCGDTYSKICKDCIDFNDIRFRVKNKINNVSQSSLKEQKSYKINCLLIDLNDISEDNLKYCIRPIKYYSFFYDKIIILCKNNGLSINFNYDNTIIFKNKDNHIIYINDYEVLKKTIKITSDLNTKEKIYELFEINDQQINIIL